MLLACFCCYCCGRCRCCVLVACCFRTLLEGSWLPNADGLVGTGIGVKVALALVATVLLSQSGLLLEMPLLL